eukprot:6188887-Pleurochrysis_carterae.AAC.1
MYESEAATLKRVQARSYSQSAKAAETDMRNVSYQRKERLRERPRVLVRRTLTASRPKGNATQKRVATGCRQAGKNRRAVT